MPSNIKVIQECIEKELKSFLKNDISLEIINTKAINNKLYNNISLINLLGSDTKFTVILSMQSNLMEALLNKFFEDGVEADEKDELLSDLIDETTNTIVGLAIKDFPLKYENLELGFPLKISKEDALKLLNENNSQSLEITTTDGSFTSSVTYETFSN